jgi:hypothetical protein
MSNKKIMDWYMTNQELLDPIINNILKKLESRMYLPTHTKITFYIDYDNVAKELLKYMYETSYLR